MQFFSCLPSECVCEFHVRAWARHLVHIACATKAIVHELIMSMLLHILKANGYRCICHMT